jgi:Subtilase family/Bacterial Ig domain
LKNKKNHPRLKQKSGKALKRMRYIIFSLLFVACVVAVGLGNLLSTTAFRASAQKVKSSKAAPVGQSGQVGEPLSTSARQQIQSLMEEKRSRTGGRKKIDSNLIYSIKMEQDESIANGVETLAVNLPRSLDGDVIIDITAKVNDQFLAKLKRMGAKILDLHPRYNSVRVEVSLDAIDAIADFPEVIFVQPKQEAMFWQEEVPANFDSERLQRTRPGFAERERNISQQLIKALDDFQLSVYTTPNGGVRKSEADVTHKANVARNTYGFDGTGIKIGVLSNGVRNLAAAQASGDLGPVTVLPGQSGTAAGQCAANITCDEGTAMLELIHDLAPGAQLFYATALPTPANFAQNIRDLRTAGCDIIVDDVFYFIESPFQDGQAPSVVSTNNQGIIAQAVNDVTADGALYFSSAGNSGNKNDNTSGVWEGDFVDGGAAPVAPFGVDAGQLHQFPADGATPAQTFNTTVGTGNGPFTLNWSDPIGGSANDYDLFILNAAGTTVLASSTNGQDGNDDPIELINATGGAGLRMVIVKFSGAARFLHLSTSRGRLTVNTPGHTKGHSSGADAFSVAATPAIGPFPNPFSATNVVETFSSDGPRKLFFQADGTPYTPGDLLATGGITRQKPDITAADGTSVTGAGGFGIQFFGTSAAAPHAAAIAALMKSANPALTPAQIRTSLTSTAIDIEAAGVDRDSGAGIIMADNVLADIGATSGAANLTIGAATITDIGGNVNGYIEPGERATLDIPLNNTGINPATAVTATLSSTTPGVVITPPATRTYPDIPATNGTSTNATPFEFVYQEGATYAADITFVLTVTYNGGIVRSFTFFVPTGQLALISTTLDTTAPASPGSNYVATTGTQTGRLNFTFPVSTCGSTKTNPGTTSTLARRYDSYTFTNTSASTICAQIVLTHSANALLHAVAYVPAFVPATPAVGYAGDGGGSTTNGAGTAQLFSINVPAGSTFTVVVSESNQNGGLNVPYNLRVTGLPAQAVPANQPPVNTVPGTQSVLEDGSLTFSSANSNQVSISDPDAGNNQVEVALTGTDGLLSLNGTTGLSFSAGDGTGDATMTFQGSITDINNALNGMSYTPTANFNGAASLTINTNDRNFTGTGGAMSDNDVVTINVTSVNDAPTFVGGPDQVASSSSPQTVPGWATSISAGPPNESSQVVHFELTNNNNALFAVQPAIDSSGTLTYTPAPGASGSATVTVLLKDDGGTANGGQDTSAPDTFVITVSLTGWMTTGDSGATEDEANPARPTYTNFTAAANSGSPAGTYVLRYNITALGNLTSLGAVNTRLRVRFRDEGAGSRVVVSLMSANLFGGVSTLGTMFDSDSFGPGSGFQTQEVIMPAVTFNFLQNVYWLEVRLIKDNTTNQPGFGAAMINQL